LRASGCIIIFSPDKNQKGIQWLFPPKHSTKKINIDNSSYEGIAESLIG
jgi:hypothetical protein